MKEEPSQSFSPNSYSSEVWKQHLILHSFLQACESRSVFSSSRFYTFNHATCYTCNTLPHPFMKSPLPPRSRESPRQMGPGYECAHSEAPKRICWCPFHCEPLCAAPLRWDAPEFSPGSSLFHSRRKESAYKGLVCPTCLRGPYCCRCRGSRLDSVAPLRASDVRLPPGRVRAGGLARRWEKRFQLHFNIH